MKGIFNFLMIVVSVLFFSSCSKELTVNEDAIKPVFESYKDSLYENYKVDVEKKNKALLNILFDSVAYKSIDLVLRDRVYLTNSEKVPDLKKSPLNKMARKLTGEGKDIDSVKKYINRFIVLRETSLKKGLSSSNAFSKITNAILISDVFKKNIIKEKDTVLEYRQLTEQIKQTNKSAQAAYEKSFPKNEWSKKQKTSLSEGFNIQQEKKKKSTQDFYSILKSKSLLLLSLLIISLLLNLLLGWLWFRNRKKTKKAKVQESDVNHQKKQEPTPISSLSSSEVTSYILQIFKKSQAILGAKYHVDCMETEIQNLQSYEADVSKRSINKQFKNQRELIAFVSPLASTYEAQIAQKLDRVIDKNSAKKYLEQQLDTENFVLKYSSSIVSDVEVRSKVTLLKKRFYDEIPKVISKSDLEIEGKNLRTDFISAIEKMIAENSQLYFPYADAQGILYDDKKSKEKERDSAIKLTLNPKDNTRATFQLLYEYSDMMLAGIQSYDILLLPICDLKSDDFDRNGNKISQNGHDGQMILENGQWKVHRKLSIKII